MNRLANKLPWWGKLLLKTILSRLPIDYRAWARLGFFRHGTMDDPAYTFGVCRQHFERGQTVAPIEQFVGLELGPGDSLSSAVIASAFGDPLARIIHEGSSRKRADVKRDGHSEP